MATDIGVERGGAASSAIRNRTSVANGGGRGKQRPYSAAVCASHDVTGTLPSTRAESPRLRIAASRALLPVGDVFVGVGRVGEAALVGAVGVHQVELGVAVAAERKTYVRSSGDGLL